METTVLLRRTRHRGNKVIALFVPYNRDIIALLRTDPSSRWEPGKRCWFFPDMPGKREQIIHLLNGVARIQDECGPDPMSPPSTAANESMTRLREWMEHRRYSPDTIANYLKALELFFGFYNDRSPADITQEDIIGFSREYIIGRNRSVSYQRIFTGALRLFFAQCERRKVGLPEIEHPRYERKLPRVLSKQEVKKLLETLPNLKHRAMLSLVYACGLRAGELLRLKPAHIDSARMIIRIEMSKGKKDRVVPVSEKVLALLREYYKLYRPKTWLFEGQAEGQPYTHRSLQQVMKEAARRSKVKGEVTLHWLRHSYATHLLESGTDLRYIQELLGHSHSKTTEIYTHVTLPALKRIRNPFDDL